MLNIEQVLSSTEHYKQAFEDGLINILQYKTSGTFILACANILQYPEFFNKNKVLLTNSFSYIEEHYLQCINKGQQPNDAADDIMVMKKIMAIGFNNLQATQIKKLCNKTATYLINYNQLRSFRPARMSSIKNIVLNTAFNPDGFHFDKAFLKKEMFAEGNINGRTLSLLYNKFPFVEYHTLLVLDKTQHLNQYLTSDTLSYIFDLQQTYAIKIPELVITYNSIGAGASVNHLHFQLFLETIPVAIFSTNAIHNGGKEPYPVYCRVFNEWGKCWAYLHQLHNTNMPYNLLFKNKKIFCLPRKITEKTFTEFNVASYGWAEMAGVFTLNDIKLFNEVSLQDLLKTVASVSALTKLK